MKELDWVKPQATPQEAGRCLHTLCRVIQSMVLHSQRLNTQEMDFLINDADEMVTLYIAADQEARHVESSESKQMKGRAKGIEEKVRINLSEAGCSKIRIDSHIWLAIHSSPAGYQLFPCREAVDIERVAEAFEVCLKGLTRILDSPFIQSVRDSIRDIQSWCRVEEPQPA
jgi:hypothetical protein